MKGLGWVMARKDTWLVSRRRSPRELTLITRSAAWAIAAVAGLAAANVGCQFTIPQPPTASVRRSPIPAPDSMAKKATSYDPKSEYSYVSPVAESLVGGTDDAVVKRRVLDAVYLCENRLQALASKMESQRDSRAIVSIVGGLLGSSSGVASAALETDDRAAKVTLASIAVASGVAVLVGQAIGDPAQELKLFNSASREYDAGVDAIRSLWHPPKGVSSDDIFFQAEAHFRRCGSIVEAGVSSADDNKSRVLERSLKVSETPPTASSTADGSLKPKNDLDGGAPIPSQ